MGGHDRQLRVVDDAASFARERRNFGQQSRGWPYIAAREYVQELHLCGAEMYITMMLISLASTWQMYDLLLNAEGTLELGTKMRALQHRVRLRG